MTDLLSSYTSMVGLEVAALWSNRNTFAKEFSDKMIQAHKQGERDLALDMSHYWDEQVWRYHDDKRSGSDKQLEPLQTGIKPNKVLKDGIVRFIEILADKSAGFFYYAVSGTGLTGVTVGQRGLAAENARVDMRINGLLDALGNALYMRATFPTGLASATITEFGAADKPTNPSVFAWRVLLDPSEYFEHEQGQTWYNSSHYMVLYAK